MSSKLNTFIQSAEDNVRAGMIAINNSKKILAKNLHTQEDIVDLLTSNDNKDMLFTLDLLSNNQGQIVSNNPALNFILDVVGIDSKELLQLQAIQALRLSMNQIDNEGRSYFNSSEIIDSADDFEELSDVLSMVEVGSHDMEEVEFNVESLVHNDSTNYSDLDLLAEEGISKSIIDTNSL